MSRWTRRPSARTAAPIVLPLAATALLAVGALVALTHGGVGPTALLVLTCLIVAVTAFVGDPPTLAMIVLVAEFTAIGFTRRPYAQLRGGPLVWHAGITLLGVAVIAYALAAMTRYATAPQRRTLDGVQVRGRAAGARRARRRDRGPAALDRHRFRGRRAAAAHARSGPMRASDLSLADDLLLYLLVVVAVSVVGGFWPAVVTAAAAGLLLNWFLTPPLHTLTIEEPQNLLALLLFVAVAVSVSSIVHLAARRAEDAARSSSDAAALLELARTVLAGADTPDIGAGAADRRRRRPRRTARVLGRPLGRGRQQRPVRRGGAARASW